MPHDRDNASCFVLDHHKTDVHSRIQPGHSRRPGNPTRPGQRGRPGDPSQTDHQQANTHHTLNRLHTKRLSSTVRITGTEELTLISEPIAPRSPVHPMVLSQLASPCISLGIQVLSHMDRTQRSFPRCRERQRLVQPTLYCDDSYLLT